MNKSTPAVTVIVPVYNAESCLSRCVDSILAQTFTDFELLLVNDGSKDQSGALCDRYAGQDARVHALHKVNGGVSSARNQGLEAATGRFVCFADADDEVAPNWLLAFMENIGELDLCVQGMTIVSGNGRGERLPSQTGALPMADLIEYLMKSALLGYSFTKCFRMDLIRKHHLRFNEAIRFREDDLFVTGYATHASSGVCLSTAHYVYYMPDGAKQYGTSPTRCVEPLFASLYQIYGPKLPDSIVENQAWCVKGAAVERMLDGERLSPELIAIYRDVIASKTSVWKDRLLDAIILHSPRLGRLATVSIRAIHWAADKH